MEKTKSNAEKTEPKVTGALLDGELTKKEKVKLALENRSIYISYGKSDNRNVAMTTELQKYVANRDKETRYIKRLIQSGNRYLVAVCASTETRDKLLDHLQTTTMRLNDSNKIPDLDIEKFVATTKQPRPSKWFIPIGAAEVGPDLLGDILAFWMFHTGGLPKVGFQVRMVQIQNNMETDEAALVWNTAVPLVANQILIGEELKHITIQSTRSCRLCGQDHLGGGCMTEHPFKTLSEPKIVFVPGRLSRMEICLRMSRQATRYERYRGRGGHAEEETSGKTRKRGDITSSGPGDQFYPLLLSDSEAEEPSEKKRKVN